MKRQIFLPMIGCLALATAVYFNVKHALNDYGVRDNEKLHPAVMAQAGTTNGGTTGTGTTVTVTHSLVCGAKGVKACTATCTNHNTTVTNYGNGQTATFTCTTTYE